MAVTDKVIISLLAVATLGVTNPAIRADMMETYKVNTVPVGIEENLSVNVDMGQVGETGNISVETTVDEQTEQASEADASVVERATAAELPETTDEIEVVEETIEETTPVEVPETVETVVVTETPAPVAEVTPAPVVINYPGQGTIEYELFVLINNERQANGLKPYTYRNDLASAASVRANEIVVSFSHTRPDGSPYYTVNSNIVYGENLAIGYESAREVFDAWMASPTHRANILDPDYEACGFALVANYDGVSNFYWAQEFGYRD